MSDLRQRASQNSMNGEEKSAKHQGLAASTTPIVSTSTPPRDRRGALIAFVSLACAMLLYTQKRTHTALPQSYALCSRTGQDIYTVDTAGAKVQCIAVHDAQIVATGSLDDMREDWSDLAVRYIGAGSVVVPGMSDSHAHILEYGASRLMDLEGAKTMEECVVVVKNYILSNPDMKNDPSKFVEGWGWDHTSWPVEQWPTAAQFDQDPVTRGRSIVLQSKDGHALWVSPSVLNSSAPYPEHVEGGIIRRDEAGQLTGVFMDNAQDLVKRPALSEGDLERRFAITVDDAVSNGLTSIHDAGFDPLSLEFFKRQAAAENMKIRIYGMTYFDEHGPYWGNTTAPIIADTTAKGKLSARSVKIFADGALRSGGAALYEPYTDNPETNGFMRIEAALLNVVIPQFLRDGWQVNVHAIGDRANGIVLDAFEAALKDVNISASRPRLEHAQIMTTEDMVRLGNLGVIASVQPTHVISDMWFAEDRLGPERVKSLYAFRTMIDSGATVTLGSDAPVEVMNPIAGFHAAVTRLAPSGQSPHGPDGWFPEQRLTRDEALRGMTINPAYASFTESLLGSLEVGKTADFVVLSQDIMTVPAEFLLDTKVVATIIDGRPIYGSI
ncbi:hypothetical protein FIBSPDRAFT_846377 [Athelia psychrophila]|uniref:Amidohydrolase 3 domain-containing protein n=1 Tax=Athelia psychrophila TaxID=1759441 RepID=A0A166WZC6_9AGAM|nr:hypothetical protein FIBSPDRAFT_846377 [Fibularhizoctonia sp. CBS 109695]